MLAGQEDLSSKRFIMCNKDQNICISVTENKIRGDHLNTTTEGFTNRSATADIAGHMSHIRNDHFGRSSRDITESRQQSNNMSSQLLDSQVPNINLQAESQLKDKSKGLNFYS